MFTGIVIIHAFVCVILIIVILMQSGRGGGLTEGFAAAESMFGGKTNAFMIKTTTIFCTIFFVTCLALATMSSIKSRSLMEDVMTPIAEQTLMNEVISQSEDQAETADEVIEPPMEQPVEQPAPDVN
jgi:preprotein translocase subunit SecG